MSFSVCVNIHCSLLCVPILACVRTSLFEIAFLIKKLLGFVPVSFIISFVKGVEQLLYMYLRVFCANSFQFRNFYYFLFILERLGLMQLPSLFYQRLEHLYLLCQFLPLSGSSFRK